jgi:hypothetical protein
MNSGKTQGQLSVTDGIDSALKNGEGNISQESEMKL